MSISGYQPEERTGYMRPTLDTLTRRLFGTSGHTKHTSESSSVGLIWNTACAPVHSKNIVDVTFLVRGSLLLYAPDRGSTFPGLSIRVIADRPGNTPSAGMPRSPATGPHKGLDSRHAHEKTNSLHIRISVRRLPVIFGRSSDENLLELTCQAHHVGYSTRLTMELRGILDMMKTHGGMRGSCFQSSYKMNDQTVSQF